MGNIRECGIEVKSFVYKGFADAKNLTDLVDRIAIYVAENRNMKLKVIRHSSRRHIRKTYLIYIAVIAVIVVIFSLFCIL